MNSDSLTACADEQIANARAASSGRSAKTIYGGQGQSMRQTVLALAGGRGLDEHESPGEATLYVLRGLVRLSAGGESCDGSAGDHLVIPPHRHKLDAIEDSAILLTVVTSPRA